MKALLDINLLLDFLLIRKGYEDAGLILDHARNHRFKAFVSAHEITTLSYFLEKDSRFRPSYREKISLLVSMTDVLSVDKAALESALASGISDFEDAVLESVAVSAKLDYIVTQNTTDFTRSRIHALTPAAYLKLLAKEATRTGPADAVREPTPSYHARPRRRRKIAT
jgi:predicted nucleic acid-binding protein